MGLTILKQKHNKLQANTHSHTQSQKHVYVDVSLLRNNKNAQMFFYQHRKVPICSLHLLRISHRGAPPEVLQHTQTPTQTQNEALFALEGV